MLLLLITVVVQVRKWLGISHEHRDDRGKPVEIGHRDSVTVLAWGGLRGGLSLALALAVPYASANAWILPTTYAVVVFSIVVQGWDHGPLSAAVPFAASAGHRKPVDLADRRGACPQCRNLRDSRWSTANVFARSFRAQA